MKNVKIKIMPLAALLLIMAATMLTLAEDLYNTSQLGQVTRKQEVYGLQVNDSFLIKGPFWYPSSASRNYLLLSDSRGFATWGQLPDTLPTQHHFTNRVTAQYFAIDTMLFTKHLTSGVVKTTTGGGVYVDTIPPNWCDSIANCINEQAWGLTGNSGTTAGTNFIGTTDSKSLYFKTKNTTAIVVDTNQNVGIGTVVSNYKLSVDGKFYVNVSRSGSGNVQFVVDTVIGLELSDISHDGLLNGLFTVANSGITTSASSVDYNSNISCSSVDCISIQASTSSNDSITNIYVKPNQVSFQFVDSGTPRGQYTFPTDTGSVGNILTVISNDGNGNSQLGWQVSTFTPSDSVTIYATTPAAGTVYFCTDCTGNGFTGHPVYYAASMWRRWD